MSPSLSSYFPPDSYYFYGYPAGKESGFVNTLTNTGAELVSTRPLSCAGGGTNIVCFANGARESALRILADEIGLPVAPNEQILRLPEEINSRISGDERDRLVQTALRDLIPEGRLIMAQPYHGEAMERKYLIHSNTTCHLNDKASLVEFVPSEYLLETYRHFNTGSEFATFQLEEIQVPCVVKATNSSAGDGVRICKTAQEVGSAQHDFSHTSSPIIIQEYLENAEEIGVQFGIPPDAANPADILGFSMQIISPEGKYLGGNFDDSTHNEVTAKIYRVLEEEILPKVRAHGWHGIGGLDVMIREDGTFVFIDGNFRMTATHVYRFNVASGHIQTPFVTMVASMEGDLDTFVQKIVPVANAASSSRVLYPVNLSQEGGRVNFNTALLYDDQKTLAENARHLLCLGVESKVLTRLIS